MSAPITISGCTRVPSNSATAREEQLMGEIVDALAAAQSKTDNVEKPTSEILKDVLAALKQASTLSQQTQTKLAVQRAKLVRDGITSGEQQEALAGIDHKLEAEREKTVRVAEKVRLIEGEHKRLFMEEIFKRPSVESDDGFALSGGPASGSLAKSPGSPRLQALKDDIEKLKQNLLECPKCV